MQISRRFLLASAAAGLLLPNLTFAQDTPAQIKARQALEQLKASQAQPAVQTAAPAAQPQPPAVQQPAPVTVATPAPPVLNAPTPSSPDAIERAREALRQKLSAPSEQMIPPVTAPPATPPPATQVMAPAPAASSSAQFQPLPGDSNSEAAEKARAALQKNLDSMPASRPVVSANPETRGMLAKKRSRHEIIMPAFAPLSGPPSGLPASKEEKLHSLLQQYQADQITPEQYHVQRAQILGEP